MSVIRTTFQVVKLRAVKTGKCKWCGKRRTYSCTFEQTINPWNKNKQGQVKSTLEIRHELADEATRWKLKPLYCANDICQSYAPQRRSKR